MNKFNLLSQTFKPLCSYNPEFKTLNSSKMNQLNWINALCAIQNQLVPSAKMNWNESVATTNFANGRSN